MFNGPYFDWSQKRAKGIIDNYGHQFFFGKSILDLGCGHADISGVLYRLGATITAVDVRQEHLKVAAKKFPGIQTIRADLDQNWPFAGKKFDMILDMGLLCHLSNYEAHLKQVCAATNILILETAVCDSYDPEKNVITKDSKITYDGSINGTIAQVSDAAIERVLKNCGMNFKRMDNAKFNSGVYTYDWQSKLDGSFNIHKRRIWFAVKSTAPAPAITDPANAKLPTSVKIQLPTGLQAPPVPKMVASARHPNMPLVDFSVPSVATFDHVKSEKKNIKTAVCISGHLRTFDANFRSVLDNLLNQLDCDVFIHTWDILGLSWRHTDGSLYNTKTSQLMSSIDSMYKPKKIIVEPSRILPETPIMRMRLIDHRDIPGILSMYYKIEECNKLKQDYEKENNFKYKCVIRFRGDLFLEQPFPVDLHTDLNNLYIPMFGNFGGLNDQLAYGSSEIMDKYSSLYSNLEGYLHSGAVMHPERLLQYHIDKQKLPVLKVNFKFLIKRANGLVQNNMLLERALGFIR